MARDADRTGLATRRATAEAPSRHSLAAIYPFVFPLPVPSGERRLTPSKVQLNIASSLLQYFLFIRA